MGISFWSSLQEQREGKSLCSFGLSVRLKWESFSIYNWGQDSILLNLINSFPFEHI